MQGRGKEAQIWLDSFDAVTPCTVQEVRCECADSPGQVAASPNFNMQIMPSLSSPAVDPAAEWAEICSPCVQLLFSSGPKLLKDSDPDRGGCWALIRKVQLPTVLPHLTQWTFISCRTLLLLGGLADA